MFPCEMIHSDQFHITVKPVSFKLCSFWQVSSVLKFQHNTFHKQTFMKFYWKLSNFFRILNFV